MLTITFLPLLVIHFVGRHFKISNNFFNVAKYLQLSIPKFNEQLNWTEFEVRLHSYRGVHHHPTTTTTNSLLLLLTAPSGQAGKLYNYTVRVQCSHYVLRRLTLKFTWQYDFDFFVTEFINKLGERSSGYQLDH